MMNKSEHTTISKFLSYVLRHKPELIDLQLDKNGWANINELIAKANISGELTPSKPLSIDKVKQVVSSCDKRRFTISEDNTRIRANQGHSVNVDLGLQETTPPSTLYHGTTARFVSSIISNGLTPGKRNHVHLSTNIETAYTVGARHGKPFILTINALMMHQDGYEFFLAENGVWLTKHVPNEFIDTN